MIMSNKVTFIGHRKIFIHINNIEEKLKDAIKEEIDNGCRLFIVGSHGEFDKLVLQICRKFRKEYPDIDIEVVITSINQIKKKTENDIFGAVTYQEYEDVKTILFDIEDVHYKRRIIESNKQMIDECDTIICYVDPKRYPSGAKMAMNYAKKKGLHIVNLYKQ